ncbi:MAG: hypothetical protein RI953_2165, partial [Pseudomonadota bacterium]
MKTRKSKSSDRQRFGLFTKTAAFAGLFSIIPGCGDGRPEFSEPTLSKQLKAQILSVQAKDQNYPEVFPLASDFLRHSNNSFGPHETNRTLAEFNFSSVVGDLPESVGELSEGLGLVADNNENSLRTFFGKLPSGLAWSAIGKSQPLSLDDGGTELLHEVQLSFKDIPIHGARIKSIHDHASNTTTYMSGSVPQWMMNSSVEQVRSKPFSLTTWQARLKASQALGFVDWRFHSPSRIYLAQENNSLLPAYVFTVSAESPEQGRGPRIPVEVAVSADTGDVLWQRPLAMHAVNGQAMLYVENKKAAGGDAAPLTSVTLPNLLGDGSSLSHPLFDVMNCHQNARINEPGDGSVCNMKNHGVSQGNYSSFTYSSEVYDELISYAAVTKAMDWFNAIDTNSLRTSWDETKWPGSRANFGLQPSGSNGGSEVRLNIFVRTRTPVPTTNTCSGEDTTPDNAQYLWAGNTGRGSPEILIGYGGYVSGQSNCYKLRDLGKDMDVIMHEFGHHIVFRGLSNAKSQSVALHEGFADYFTYAISGNNRLA